MGDPAPIAFLASLAIVGIGWFGRWDVTIGGGSLIAGLSAFVAGAPLAEQGVATALVAAAVTQLRIGLVAEREASLRRFRGLKDQVGK